MRVVSFGASAGFGWIWRLVAMLTLFAAIAVARQFITLQHPIPITIRLIKHVDQADIKLMLFDVPIFIAIQRGKVAILRYGKFVEAERAIIILIELLGVHH